MTKVKYKYPYSYRKRKYKQTKQAEPRKVSSPPIVTCLKKGIINQDEYWAATFFYNLFRLRYGSHLVKSHNFYRSNSSKSEMPENEYEDRNLLYKEVIDELQKNRLLKIILNICVYEITPKFLNFSTKNKDCYSEYLALKHGLAIIYKIIEKKHSLCKKNIV